MKTPKFSILPTIQKLLTYDDHMEEDPIVKLRSDIAIMHMELSVCMDYTDDDRLSEALNDATRLFARIYDCLTDTQNERDEMVWPEDEEEEQ